jgi:hypothetical protein
MESADDGQPRDWAAPYRRAHLEGHLYYYEMHEPESLSLLQRLFREILETEAPVQRDLLYRRAATVWGIERIGSRIRANLDRALGGLLKADREVEQDGDTITLRERPVLPREPGDGVVRKVTEVPPAERRTALLEIIAESPGMTETELTTHTARFFGWNRRGSDIARAFAQDLLELREEGRIDGLPDRVVLR